MRAFLYLATVLTFTTGAQLTVLGEHMAAFFAWSLGPPMSAVFMGASFATASAMLLWAARQTDWSRAAIPRPLAEMLTDSVRCLYEQGHIRRREAGVIAASADPPGRPQAHDQTGDTAPARSA